MARNIRYKWSYDERKKIESSLKNSLKCNHIASILKVPYDSLINEIRRGGGRLRYTAEKAEEIDIATRRVERRIFNHKEQDQISEMLKEGTSFLEIRRNLKCGYEALRTYMSENHADILEAKAPSLRALRTRIESLEEHIKILYDLLEGK
jgi:IS30 family transposase